MPNETAGVLLPQNPSNQRAIQFLCEEYRKYNRIDPAYYDVYNVKRGLRNNDGTGVLAGLTQVCNVHGYVLDEGEKAPVDGVLTYRGIKVNDLIEGCVQDDRFGFEEAIWLLLFGRLPNREQLETFRGILASQCELPTSFFEDIILKNPSRNLMNMLARSVLALYAYDPNPDSNEFENLIRQSISLIARMPVIMVAAYQVKRRAFERESLYVHDPRPDFSIAENILHSLRSDMQFTREEAKLLDICLILHAEHGGGNNSAFTARSVSSTGSDTYSAIAAAIGALKGPRHGGANFKVMEMLDFLKEEVANPDDDAQVKDFLARLIRGETGDRSGLVYGMGHAVYTRSDPRAVILKKYALRMAAGTPIEREFQLLDAVERLTPEVFASIKGSKKDICANVDMYSGLVYKMLKIPYDMYTALFAAARTTGWCAHRVEEVVYGDRLIRPAYKSLAKDQAYLPMEERD
ncbi:MAG: citrate synthase [Provencibacterium sp.]|nr:citrate synthase [Provencibacterium sp.]